MSIVLPYFSRITDILNTLADAVVIVSDSGCIVHINHQAELLFGYSCIDLIGQKIECLVPIRFRHNHQIYRDKYIEHPTARPMGIGLELFGLKKDGTEFPIEISLSPLLTEVGKFTIASIADTSIRKKHEQSEAMIAAAIKLMNDAIIGKDLDDRVTIWNKGAERLFGYTEKEAIGQSLNILVPKEKKEEHQVLLQKLKHGEHIVEYETQRLHKDKTLIPVALNISPVWNAQGRLLGAAGVVRDITKQKNYESKLKYLAEHDPLTGLINSTILKDLLSHGMHLSKRNKTSMAVCFLDLDDFKKINDTYGHSMGDQILIAVSNCFQKCIRESDILARVGGDEFVIILLDITSEKDVIKIIKNIFQHFAEGFEIDGKKILITLSVGFLIYPKDSTNDLLKKADSAMYYAKLHGKNDFKKFDALCSYDQGGNLEK